MSIVHALRPRVRTLAAVLALTSLTPLDAQVDPGDLDASQLLGPGLGGFTGAVNDGDQFAASVASLGDLNGDGVPDLALGAPHDDDGGPGHGAVWILFMAGDGTVSSHSKISETSGGLLGRLGNNVEFGHALACAGDVDGDGVADLAVGSPRDGDGGPKHGAVWLLFLNPDGTVKAEQKISETSGGFTGDLQNSDEFGRSVASAGDVDGDGIPDLAVGALNDDDGSQQVGAIWILLLNADGTVRDNPKISGTVGGFGGDLDNSDDFARSLASLGDLDGNGVPDLAAGTLNDDDGGANRGAVWIVFLAADGTAIGEQKISSSEGGFAGPLADGDGFGRGVAAVGDLDGNGVPDLLVGAPGDDGAGLDRGAAWLLLLDTDGTVLGERRYDEVTEPALGQLADGDAFGTALSAAGDVDGNGADDWIIGAPFADAGGSDRGQAHLLLLTADEPDEEEPYVPSAAVFDGKPGRATLVGPDPDAGPQDFIDEPVIVVTNSSGGGVNVRVGTESQSGEDMNFLPVQNAQTGENPGDVAAGNFGSGSGLVGALEDIVVANQGGDSFSFLPGLPDGTFGPHVEHSLLPLNAAPVGIEVGDYDLDGKLDVAVAGDGGVSVFFGDGAGGFPASAFTPLSLITDIQTGFIDGDALPDLLCTSGRQVTPAQPTEEGFATVLLGNGDGTFSVASTFASGPALASCLLGDVDADGENDALLVAHTFGSGPSGEPEGRIDLYLGDGLGGFTPSPAFGGHVSTSAQGIHPLYGMLGDLDGDGFDDAVFSSSDNISHDPADFEDEQPPVELTVLRNDGLGSFEVTLVGTAYAGKGVAPILADIFPDEDGNPDAILVWYEDAAAGLEGEPDALTTFVTAFVSDGEASFFDPSPNQFDVGDEPGNGFVGDVNPPVGTDDEPATRLDVVIPNLVDNSLSILLGDGDGGIRSEVVVPDISPTSLDDLPPGDWVGGPRQLVLADLTADGFLDAVVASWFEDGSPQPDPSTFGSLTLVDGAGATVIQDLQLDRIGELAVGDVTGDGRPDAVVAARLGASGADRVDVFPGTPEGTLALTPLSLTPSPGSRLGGGLLLIDLTGDGRLDVLTTSVDDALDEGRLLLFDSTTQQSTETALGPAWSTVQGLAVGDLTGDGLVDVAVGLDDGGLRLAEGTGAATFVAGSLDPLSAAVGGGALAMADINGDGRQDLLSSTSVDDGDVDQAFVRLLLGTAAPGVFSIQNVDALQSTGAVGALQPLLGEMNGDGAVDLILVHGTSDRISILVNQLSRFEEYGAGKAGSDDLVPHLSGSGFTTPGGQFELSVEDALGGTTGLLQFGVGQSLTGFLHVETVVFDLPLVMGGEPGVPGEGSMTLPLVVPDDPELVGVEVTLQALLLDPGAGQPAPVKLAASNGLALTVVQ
jgi:hypothetical protein